VKLTTPKPVETPKPEESKKKEASKDFTELETNPSAVEQEVMKSVPTIYKTGARQLLESVALERQRRTDV